MKRPHLSPAQINMYTRCGEQYRRRYIEKESIQPGIAQVTGNGVHAGAKVNFTQKIDSHRDLPRDEIIDAAVSGLEAEVAGGIVLTEDELSRGARNVIGDATDSVAELAGLHADEVAPDYQPVFVEKGIRLPLPSASRDIVGYIDLVDDLRRVVDFKTVKRAATQDDVDASVQLTFYAAAYQSLTSMPAESVRLDCLVKTKTPKRKLLESTRGPEDFRALAARANSVLAGINAGIFSPASDGAWWCGEKWCGYYRTCPYVRSRS